MEVQKPMTPARTSESTPLSLLEIASWQFPSLPVQETPPSSAPRMIAAIPSLQRGAVWKPGQIELLWDSILRGFPVGSLVVCPKFEGQAHHSGRHGAGWPEELVTHYLLDGQQRCNAVALAFLDAIRPRDNGEEPAATLWIDLNPAPLPPASTRRFCLRVLTTAHPWGYSLDDSASSLGIGAIRDAVASYEDGRRPRLTKSWPHQSSCPVPFSWLVEATFAGHSGESLWQAVRARCLDADVLHLPWAVKAANLIHNSLTGKVSGHLQEIAEGMMRVRAHRILALQVPHAVLMGAGPREHASDAADEGRERIHNVEHLFQRLNSAGTELRGEELLFSMIKAYWPAIELSFDAITDRQGRNYLPMPGSRLASLGIRAALMDQAPASSLPPQPGMASLRSLAAEGGAASQKRAAVQEFLGISIAPKSSAFHSCLRQVDDWLLQDSTLPNDPGMPAVLRSNLAQGAPTIFLLLIHLAQRSRKEGLSKDELVLLRRPVLALATSLHWFGINQEAAVKELLPSLHSRPLSAESFLKLLDPFATPGSPQVIHRILPPSELEKAIPAADPASPGLPQWRLWQEIVGAKEPGSAARQDRETFTWPFIDRLLRSRPLLLFAQRHYMERVFGGYDPSCVDVWKGHDRPWDYDHILPSNVLHANPRTCREACRQWVNTIGNLRAWPLEENRGRHDELAEQSIPESCLKDSLILSLEERSAFSLSWNDVNDPVKAAAFINAARARLLRIYQDWYDSLSVASLAGQHSPRV
jgi:hypothetical protein